MRNNRSAKVRRRESHSGHSQPTNSERVSTKCAKSRTSNRHGPMAEPSRRTTRMPVRARPRLHPVIVGNNNRLTARRRMVNPSRQAHNHRHALPGGTVKAVNAMVAATASPGSTSMAKAPARTCQGAAPFGVAWGRVVGVFSTTTVTSSPGRVWRSYSGPHPVPSGPEDGSRLHGHPSRCWTP
ncbi:Uncharacterised protein [Mycobacterium tuberculosis]|nr:Uncharacterised protein [Mycobacterium tuberculosis]